MFRWVQLMFVDKWVNKSMDEWVGGWMDGGWSPFLLPHSHLASSVVLSPYYSRHRILRGWSLRDHCLRCYTSDLGKSTKGGKPNSSRCVTEDGGSVPRI